MTFVTARVLMVERRPELPTALQESYEPLHGGTLQSRFWTAFAPYGIGYAVVWALLIRRRAAGLPTPRPSPPS